MLRAVGAIPFVIPIVAKVTRTTILSEASTLKTPSRKA